MRCSLWQDMLALARILVKADYIHAKAWCIPLAVSCVIRRVRPTNSKYTIAFAMDKKDDGKRIIFHRLFGAGDGTWTRMLKTQVSEACLSANSNTPAIFNFCPLFLHGEDHRGCDCYYFKFLFWISYHEFSIACFYKLSRGDYFTINWCKLQVFWKYF